MSGHSKWATIHRAKEASDQKRGQAFTKVALAIRLAVVESGGSVDPAANIKLRLAVEKARGLNMPKEKIQRAIDSAAGKNDSVEYFEVMYEGYAPGGVGLLVETVTDNKQRTVQTVKNMFDRNGGSMASPGAVAFNFNKSGQITITNENGNDELMLKIMDIAGVADIEDMGEGVFVIYTGVDSLDSVKNQIAAIGGGISEVALVMRPVNLVPVTDKQVAGQVLNLYDRLEEMDDVLRVYANFDMPDEFLKS